MRGIVSTDTLEPVRGRAMRKVLGSPFVDLLLGPHGVDRYLELIRPALTIRDARAEVIAVRRQTARSVTLSLRPNGAWDGFRAGQFVRVGFEIDGVRRTRTYSPACSEHGSRRELELTVTAHPGGLVSNHLRDAGRSGAVVHLAPALGGFVLPDSRPERLILVSGGSGITPVMSMLRTLCDEGHDGRIRFLHYARTEGDWLYGSEVRRLAARHAGVDADYRATRSPAAGGGHVDARALGDVDGTTWAAVCGPPSLIDGARAAWSRAGGVPEQLLTETFTRLAPSVAPGETAQGSLRFLRSEQSAQIVAGTLLEQAEGAGLTPEFGCRMGICHTCTCRKASGAVRNVLTGTVSDEEDEDIQLCISVPTGDVALEL
jgi:stearoyl-CoA 9-desaturase NADPH oxidoreductase